MSFVNSLLFPILVAIIVFAVIYLLALVFNVPRGLIVAIFVAIVAFLIALKKMIKSR